MPGQCVPVHTTPVHTALQRTLCTSEHRALVHTTHRPRPLAGAFCADSTHRAPTVRASAHQAPALIAPHTTVDIARRCIFHQGLLIASLHIRACTSPKCAALFVCVGEFCTPADSASPCIQWRISLPGAYPGSHRAPVDSATRTQTGRNPTGAGDEPHALHLLH